MSRALLVLTMICGVRSWMLPQLNAPQPRVAVQSIAITREEARTSGNSAKASYINLLEKAASTELGSPVRITDFQNLRYANPSVAGKLDVTLKKRAESLWDAEIKQNGHLLLVAGGMRVRPLDLMTSTSVMLYTSPELKSLENVQSFRITAEDRTESGALRTASLLSFLDESRTAMIGGADVFRSVNLEGKSIRVARIPSLTIHGDPPANTCCVNVVSDVSSLPSVMNFHQQLTDITGSVIFASSLVTLECIETATNKPCTFPDWLLSRPVASPF